MGVRGASSKMGMRTLDAIPGKQAKSAEVFEKKEDALHSCAKECAKRAKESGLRWVWRGWALMVTTHDNTGLGLLSNNIAGL